MLSQKYTYKDLVIEAEYESNYVIVAMYRYNIKVHESITYLDVVKISGQQIPIRIIEMVMGEPFDWEKFEVFKTEYVDD